MSSFASPAPPCTLHPQTPSFVALETRAFLYGLQKLPPWFSGLGLDLANGEQCRSLGERGE